MGTGSTAAPGCPSLLAGASTGPLPLRTRLPGRSFQVQAQGSHPGYRAELGASVGPDPLPYRPPAWRLGTPPGQGRLCQQPRLAGPQTPSGWPRRPAQLLLSGTRQGPCWLPSGSASSLRGETAKRLWVGPAASWHLGEGAGSPRPTVVPGSWSRPGPHLTDLPLPGQLRPRVPPRILQRWVSRTPPGLPSPSPWCLGSA